MTKQQKRKRPTIIIIVGVIVGISLISYQFKASPKTVDNDAEGVTTPDENPTALAPESNAYVLKKQDLELVEVVNGQKSVYWPVSGRVVPKNATLLYSEVQGKVVNKGFRLKEGTNFSKGSTLLVLDAKEFRLGLEAQRSAFLNILTGMMPDLKADYPDNYQQWHSYVQKYQIGSPLKPLPNTKTDAEQYFVTANEVYNTYFSIKAQEERLTKYTIKAPYAGLVTEANADKGSLVSPGQLLGKIINNRNYELEAAAGLEVASKLKVGDQVVFKSNELDGEWLGTVLRINDIVDAKTQNIPIYFHIEGKGLKAGLYLEGKYAAQTFESVFTIPADMLTRDGKVLVLREGTIFGKPVSPVAFIQDSIVVRGLANKDIVVANQFEVPVEGLKLSN